MPRQLARVTHDWAGRLAHPHSGQACRPSLVGTMRARHRGQSVGCQLPLVDLRLGVDAGRCVFAALSPPFLSFEGFGEFAAVDPPAGAGRAVTGARGVQEGDRIVEVFQEGGGVSSDSRQGGSGWL